jgi:hypothetical protein
LDLVIGRRGVGSAFNVFVCMEIDIHSVFVFISVSVLCVLVMLKTSYTPVVTVGI